MCRFEGEVKAKYGESFVRPFYEAFEYLPLSCRINKRVLVCMCCEGRWRVDSCGYIRSCTED
jgi:hypothetical protein